MRNVGMFLAFVTVSFFLPVVTDANKTYVSRFSYDNYSAAYPYDAQTNVHPETIHRRRIEEEEEKESNIKQKAKDKQDDDDGDDDVDHEATTGLLNFRAASLPEEIQKVVGAIADDYMLSLDILLPQIPSSYDLQVNQVGDNSFNSNYNSQTKTSVVKETDIGLQFNTRSLRTIEIKISFEEVGQEASMAGAVITEEPSMAHASPVMSQTIVPEEISSSLTSSSMRCEEVAELEPILVGAISPNGMTSSLFRHMSK